MAVTKVKKQSKLAWAELMLGLLQETATRAKQNV